MITGIDRSQDVLENGLINFKKCRKISGLITELGQFQRTPFTLEAVPLIQEYLLDYEVVPEEKIPEVQ